MSAYSAVSHGHCHPRLVAALSRQAQTLAVTSRAYYNTRLPLFLERLCRLTGQDQALPTNTGLEAVETALKAARKWAYKVKGVPEDSAEIIACSGNFHGRSIAIIAMSTEPQYRDGFGPFPRGFKLVPFGDAKALERAITASTAAFLVEPIQGEQGIIVPPRGYLAECERICRRHNVLLIADEVQTGLGRTGRLLACDHEGVKPDGLILGKALGGGLLPVSAFLGRREVMGVFEPGDHGSTFGGNPLAAAVALEARSEEHTSELQSQFHLVCRLLLENSHHRNLHSFPTRRSSDLARVRPRGREARRTDSRQSPGRRTAAGIGVSRPPRGDGRVRAGRSRQHLRRQSARSCGCARGEIGRAHV